MADIRRESEREREKNENESERGEQRGGGREREVVGRKRERGSVRRIAESWILYACTRSAQTW
jgi:hypothetical protein